MGLATVGLATVGLATVGLSSSRDAVVHGTSTRRMTLVCAATGRRTGVELR